MRTPWIALLALLIVVPVTPDVVYAQDALGVSRQQVIDLFTQPDLNYDFGREGRLSDGRRRVFGSSPDGMVLLEMVGPPSNLTEISVTIELTDDITAFTLNALSMAGLLNLVIPEWRGGGMSWLTESIQEAVSGGRREITIRYGAVVTYRLYEGMSAVGLFLRSSSSREG